MAAPASFRFRPLGSRCTLRRPRRALLVAGVVSLLCVACGSSEDDVTELDATETNFFVLACNTDEECAGGTCRLHPEPPAHPDSPRGRCVPPPEEAPPEE